MKTLFFVCRLAAVLPIMLIGGKALAQCGYGEDTEIIQCVNQGKVTEMDSTTCQSGASGGSADYFCSESQGACTDGTVYYTASITYDPENCGGSGGGGGGGGGGCGSVTKENPHPQCCCSGNSCSPIIIDTNGNGFHLTNTDDGVRFDISGTGHPLRLSWTAAGKGNAFLALDRNGNGKIDNGKELFGNFTDQPESDQPNGYQALAVFDLPENGGNGDGVIDRRDAIWPKLLLWIDENHDGLSQANELHHLDEMGVHSLALKYHNDPYVDQYGNLFRYKGRVNPEGQPVGDDVDRISYDVFFHGKVRQNADRSSNGLDIESWLTHSRGHSPDECE
jgi:hypothetical protein